MKNLEIIKARLESLAVITRSLRQNQMENGVNTTTRNVRRFLLIAATAGGLLTSVSVEGTTVDLTGSNNSGTINGALFTYTDQQPTGTGVIDPFLRLQDAAREQGYNTSGGTPLDTKAGIYTHDITFADLSSSTATINGVLYYTVLLDVNEADGKKSLLSLDQLQFYTSSTGSQTTTNVSSLGTLRYTFNPGDYVLLDYARNSGSGSGDMFAYIPASYFAGTLQTDFVYLYSEFGYTASADANSEAGFEEWALILGTTPPPTVGRPVPEGMPVWFGGAILASLCLIDSIRRRRRQPLKTS